MTRREPGPRRGFLASGAGWLLELLRLARGSLRLAVAAAVAAAAHLLALSLAARHSEGVALFGGTLLLGATLSWRATASTLGALLHFYGVVGNVLARLILFGAISVGGVLLIIGSLDHDRALVALASRRIIQGVCVAAACACCGVILIRIAKGTPPPELPARRDVAVPEQRSAELQADEALRAEWRRSRRRRAL